MRLWLWRIAIILLVAGFVGAQMWLNKTPDELERVKLPPPPTYKKATLTPGRVVELHTSRGEIDFVLFEKDSPKTTKRIADLVQKGCYNGVKFSRVENWIIQTDECKEKVKPMGIEVREGLSHAKGAVGMARLGNDFNSNTSVFYILLDPQSGLDLQYTVFGRLISGMDVAMKMQKNDVIKSAEVRPLTEADKKKFYEMLTIEAERKTE